MSKEEESYILCLPQNCNLTIVEGSTITNCCKCDTPVWISPESITTMLDRKAKPICVTCIRKEELGELQPPSLDQLKEMIRDIRKKQK